MFPYLEVQCVYFPKTNCTHNPIASLLGHLRGLQVGTSTAISVSKCHEPPSIRFKTRAHAQEYFSEGFRGNLAGIRVQGVLVS